MSDTPYISTGLQLNLEENNLFALQADTQERFDQLLQNQQQQYPEYQVPKVVPFIDKTLRTDDLLDSSKTPPKETLYVDALFSDDPKIKALADRSFQEDLNKNNTYRSNAGGVNIFDYDKSMDKYIHGKFGYNLNFSDNTEVNKLLNDDYYYKNEYMDDNALWRSTKNIARGFSRVVTTGLLKLGEGFAGLAGMIANIGENNYWKAVADNSALRWLEDKEQYVKDQLLPVFHDKDYNNRGFFSHLMDATWWTDSAADGAAFMLSAMIPGLGASKLGLLGKTGNLARLGTTGKVLRTLTGAENWGGVANFVYSTGMEAMTEGVHLYRAVEKDLKERRRKGEEGYADLTDDDIAEIAGTKAQNDFIANIPILAFSNAWENRAIFNKIGTGERRLLDTKAKTSAIKIAEDLGAEYKPRTLGTFFNSNNKLLNKVGIEATSRVPFYGAKAAQGIAWEGFWEENAQLVAQRLNETADNAFLYDDRMNMDNNYLGIGSFFKQLLHQTQNAIAGVDHEAAENIGAGAVIGVMGGGLASRFSNMVSNPTTNADGSVTPGRFSFKNSERTKIVDQLVKQVSDITKAKNDWMTFDVYKRDDENREILDANKRPIVDENKVNAKLKEIENLTNTNLDAQRIKEPSYVQFIENKLMNNYLKAVSLAGKEDAVLERLSDVKGKSSEELSKLFGLNAKSFKQNPLQIQEYAKRMLTHHKEVFSKEYEDKIPEGMSYSTYETRQENRKNAIYDHIANMEAIEPIVVNNQIKEDIFNNDLLNSNLSDPSDTLVIEHNKNVFLEAVYKSKLENVKDLPQFLVDFYKNKYDQASKAKEASKNALTAINASTKFYPNGRAAFKFQDKENLILQLRSDIIQQNKFSYDLYKDYNTYVKESFEDKAKGFKNYEEYIKWISLQGLNYYLKDKYRVETVKDDKDVVTGYNVISPDNIVMATYKTEDEAKADMEERNRPKPITPAKEEKLPPTKVQIDYFLEKYFKNDDMVDWMDFYIENQALLDRLINERISQIKNESEQNRLKGLRTNLDGQLDAINNSLDNYTEKDDINKIENRFNDIFKVANNNGILQEYIDILNEIEERIKNIKDALLTQAQLEKAKAKKEAAKQKKIEAAKKKAALKKAQEEAEQLRLLLLSQQNPPIEIPLPTNEVGDNKLLGEKEDNNKQKDRVFFVQLPPDQIMGGKNGILDDEKMLVFSDNTPMAENHRRFNAFVDKNLSIQRNFEFILKEEMYKIKLVFPNQTHKKYLIANEAQRTNSDLGAKIVAVIVDKDGNEVYFNQVGDLSDPTTDKSAGLIVFPYFANNYKGENKRKSRKTITGAKYGVRKEVIFSNSFKNSKGEDLDPYKDIQTILEKNIPLYADITVITNGYLLRKTGEDANAVDGHQKKVEAGKTDENAKYLSSFEEYLDMQDLDLDPDIKLFGKTERLTNPVLNRDARFRINQNIKLGLPYMFDRSSNILASLTPVTLKEIVYEGVNLWDTLIYPSLMKVMNQQALSKEEELFLRSILYTQEILFTPEPQKKLILNPRNLTVLTNKEYLNFLEYLGIELNTFTNEDKSTISIQEIMQYISTLRLNVNSKILNNTGVTVDLTTAEGLPISVNINDMYKQNLLSSALPITNRNTKGPFKKQFARIDKRIGFTLQKDAKELADLANNAKAPVVPKPVIIPTKTDVELKEEEIRKLKNEIAALKKLLSVQENDSNKELLEQLEKKLNKLEKKPDEQVTKPDESIESKEAEKDLLKQIEELNKKISSSSKEDDITPLSPFRTNIPIEGTNTVTGSSFTTTTTNSQNNTVSTTKQSYTVTSMAVNKKGETFLPDHRIKAYTKLFDYFVAEELAKFNKSFILLAQSPKALEIVLNNIFTRISHPDSEFREILKRKYSVDLSKWIQVLKEINSLLENKEEWKALYKKSTTLSFRTNKKSKEYTPEELDEEYQGFIKRPDEVDSSQETEIMKFGNKGGNEQKAFEIASDSLKDFFSTIPNLISFNIADDKSTLTYKESEFGVPTFRGYTEVFNKVLYLTTGVFDIEEQLEILSDPVNVQNFPELGIITEKINNLMESFWNETPQKQIQTLQFLASFQVALSQPKIPTYSVRIDMSSGSHEVKVTEGSLISQKKIINIWRSGFNNLQRNEFISKGLTDADKEQRTAIYDKYIREDSNGSKSLLVSSNIIGQVQREILYTKNEIPDDIFLDLLGISISDKVFTNSNSKDIVIKQIQNIRKELVELDKKGTQYSIKKQDPFEQEYYEQFLKKNIIDVSDNIRSRRFTTNILSLIEFSKNMGETVSLLAGLEDKYGEMGGSGTYLNADNKLKGAYYIPNLIGMFVNQLNKATNIDQIGDKYPHLAYLSRNNVWNNTSRYLEKLFWNEEDLSAADLEDQKIYKVGDRNPSYQLDLINIDTYEEVSDNIKDPLKRSFKRIDTSDLTENKKLLLDAATYKVLGVTEILRAEASPTNFVIRLKHVKTGVEETNKIVKDTFIDYSTFLKLKDPSNKDLGNKTFSDHEGFMDIIKNYFVGELLQYKWFNENKDKVYSFPKGETELNIFEGILGSDQEFLDRFKEEALKEDFTYDKIFTMLLEPENAEIFNRLINQYFEKSAEDLTNKIKNLPKLEKDIVFEWHTTGKRMAFIANDFISKYEYQSLLFGPLYHYSNPYKRGKYATNTGFILHLSPKLNDMMKTAMGTTFADLRKTEVDENKKPINNVTLKTDYNKVRSIISKENKFQSDYYDENINNSILTQDTIRLREYSLGRPLTDVEKNTIHNDLSAYNEINIDDAQGNASLDFYKFVSISYQIWDEQKEREYKRQILYYRYHILKQELTDIELKELNHTDPKAFFNPLKLAKTGPNSNNSESPLIPEFDKMSIKPLIPEGLHKSGNIEILNAFIDNNIDYQVAASGTKVWKPSKDFIINLQKSSSTNKFEGIVPTLNISPNQVREGYFINLKYQLSTEGFKDEANFGTQVRKRFYEVMDSPMALLPSMKGERDKLVKLEEEYRNITEKIMNFQKEDFYNKFKIQTNDNGRIKSVIDYEQFISHLRETIETNGIDTDILDYFQYDTTTKKAINELDYSKNITEVKKALLNLFDNALRKMKINGSSLIQVSSQMFSKPTQEQKEKYGSSDLQYYRLLFDDNGKPIETTTMGVKIAWNPNYYSLLELKNNNNEKIKDLDELNVLMQDPKWKEKHLEKFMMFGYRIPFNNLNFSDSMEIMQFLPESEGSIIITPPEHIIKSGSDFDIDKLYIIQPTLNKYGKLVKEGKAGHENDLLRNFIKAAKSPLYYEAFTMPSSTFVAKTAILSLLAHQLPEGDIKERSLLAIKRLKDVNSSVKDKEADIKFLTNLYEAKLPASENIKMLKSQEKALDFQTGKRDLGIYALFSTFHSLFKKIDFKINSSYMVGDKNEVKNIYLPLLNEQERSKILKDNTISYGGNISLATLDTISIIADQLMSSTVDLANDTYYAQSGINKANINIVINLLQQGVDFEKILIFINQPILKEVYKMYFDKNSTDGDYSLKHAMVEVGQEYNLFDGKYETANGDVENKFKLKIIETIKPKKDSPETIKISSTNKMLKHPHIEGANNLTEEDYFDTEDLVKYLNKDYIANLSKEEKEEYTENQRKYLSYFAATQWEGKEISALYQVYNYDGKKMGSKLAAEQNLISRENIKNNPLFFRSVIDKFEKETMLNPFDGVQDLVDGFKVILPNLYSEENERMYKEIKNYTSLINPDDLNYLSSLMESEWIEFLFKNFYEVKDEQESEPLGKYFMSKVYQMSGQETPNYFADRFLSTIDGLPTRIREEIKSLDFVKKIVAIEYKKPYESKALVFTKDIEENEVNKQLYTKQFENLINFNPIEMDLKSSYSEEDINKIQKIFKLLANYSIDLTGIQNTPKSLIDYLPNSEYVKMKDETISKWNSLSYEEQQAYRKAFVFKFAQNNGYNLKLNFQDYSNSPLSVDMYEYFEEDGSVVKKEQFLEKSKEVEKTVVKFIDHSNKLSRVYYIKPIVIQTIIDKFKDVSLPEDTEEDTENGVIGDPTNSMEPKDFINYSGAAPGADTEWENEGKIKGIGKQVNYRPDTLTRLTPEQYKEAKDAYRNAANSLQRNFLDPDSNNSKVAYAGKLMTRDYLQAKAADAIFAISDILDPLEIGKPASNGIKYPNKSGKQAVDGGTGYAVEMAIVMKKPVYVFHQGTDPNHNHRVGWYKWSYNTSSFFLLDEVPVLTKKYAGIGTRHLNEAGKQAIKDVYKKTFGDRVSKTTSNKILNKEVVSNREFTPDNLSSLKENEVFVFGSNPVGINGNRTKMTGGAALVANLQGWVKPTENMNNRISESGKAYGITTVTYPGKKRSVSLEDIKKNISKFIEYATQNPQLKFYVVKIGTNLAGYSIEEIKEQFNSINNSNTIPENIILPKEFEVRDNTSSVNKKENQSLNPEVLGGIQAKIIKDLVFEGKAVTTIRTFGYHKEFYKGDGVYKIIDNDKLVNIKLLGTIKKKKDVIEIMNPSTGITIGTMTLDEFGKDEGFDDWKGFLKNQQWSTNFILEKEIRYLYSIIPYTINDSTNTSSINMPTIPMEGTKTIFNSGANSVFNSNQDNTITQTTLEETPTGPIDFILSPIAILSENRSKTIFNKGIKNKWTLDKVLNEIGGFAIYKSLFNEEDLSKPVTENQIDQLIIDLNSNYSYIIEVNTSTEKAKYQKGYEVVKSPFGWYSIVDGEGLTYKDGFKTEEEANTYAEKYNKGIEVPTSHYSSMTVPGGTNYTENEIATPLITPSIKGHAQFSTDNGIGWFRSDIQAVELSAQNAATNNKDNLTPFDNDYGKVPTKTRRILEVQSDLFQKGRDENQLTGSKEVIAPSLTTISKEEYSNASKLGTHLEYESIKYNGFLYFAEAGKDEETGELVSTYFKRSAETKNINIDEQGNQFLQLLNKDNNWVTFFVKSIIQDSAKKGYEKVLFPTGSTASKVEGHTTLEEFKKEKENRISLLQSEIERKKNYKFTGDTFNVDKGIGWGQVDEYTNLGNGEYYKNGNLSTKQEYETALRQHEDFVKKEGWKKEQDEINQLKQELERVETEGFGALKPIYNFYENTVTNILNKNYKGNINKVTDEYGNTWFEVEIDQERDLQPIDFTRRSTVLISNIKNKLRESGNFNTKCR